MRRGLDLVSQGTAAAFIALAVALMAAGSWRTPIALEAFDWLFWIIAAGGAWAAYQRGYLRKTPKQIYTDVKTSGRPAAPPLQVAAFYVGIAAWIVIKFT